MHGDDAVTTLDNLEAQKQVKRTLQYIENRLDKIQNFLEDQDMSLHMNVLRDDVQKEFRQVCENYLRSFFLHKFSLFFSSVFQLQKYVMDYNRILF